MADALLPVQELTRVKKFALWHPMSRRLHHIMLLMLGFFVCTYMRINLAITMTCMVNSTAVALLEEETQGSLVGLAPEVQVEEFLNETFVESGGTCQKGSNKKVVVDYGGSLIWDHRVQNILFSANFWGGMLVVIPSMFLIQRYSARILLLISVIIYVVSSAAVPYAALHLPYYVVFICRFIMGLGDGVINPASNAVIANWFPVTERSTALALFTTGNQMAGAVGNPLAAALCQSTFGWSSVFYVGAFGGTIWCVVWHLSSSDHPIFCKTITHKEKLYLEANCMRNRSNSQKRAPVPYKRIFTSAPFLAVLFCQMQVNFTITLIQVYLPSYFKEVLYLGVMSNGAFSSLPNISQFFFKLFWSVLMDKMKEKNILSPTAAVKISHVTATLGSATCMMALVFFVDCSTPTLALIVLCLHGGALGTFTSGAYTSLLSLAPKYTGTLSSVVLTVSIFARLATPTLVGILKTTGSLEEWRLLYTITATSSVMAAIVFAIFGSGECQDWGRDKAESLQLARPDLTVTLKKNDESQSLDQLVKVQRARTESICV